MSRRAVFLDRDGVVIRDVDLLTRCDQVDVYPSGPQAIARLRSSNFAVVVVSNQPVVARGLATEQDVEAVNTWIQEILTQQCQDSLVDRFYFCPHHPNANVAEYRITCECRKPQPGMLWQAARELDLDLSSSFMVGDRRSDILAGQRAGCRTILLETGMHTAPPIIGSYRTGQQDPAGLGFKPDYVCSDLNQAVDFILATP